MKKLVVFFLVSFVASAQAACTFELRNNTNDFIWVVSQDLGSGPMNWQQLPEDITAQDFRIDPKDQGTKSKQVTVSDDAPLYIYLEKRSMGGRSTPGLIGGTWLKVDITKVYEITRDTKKECPTGAVNYSKIQANKVPGLTIKKK